MDFWDLTKLMFRRWYVSVPLLLVAAGATLFVAMEVKPDYVATSYVQLVPPAVTPKANDETKASARNPWLDLGLASLTKAGVISVQDQRVVDQLKETGLSDDFTLTQDSQVPVVTFEVVGTDEAQATQTSERLVKRFAESVEGLQKEYGPPRDQMITARRLDLGDNVKESMSKVKRALIAVAGVGILLAIAATVAVDAGLRLRRRTRDDADQAFTPATPTAPRPEVDKPAAGRAVETKPDAVPATVRPAGEYGSKRAGPARVGEETAVISMPPPGEETVVLPAGSWQAGRGRANGSNRP